MMQIPNGKSVADMLPTFSDVTQNVGLLGEHEQSTCACCGKPFSRTRRPQLGFRLYPVISLVPVVFEYRICGKCEARYREGGFKRDRVLAAIQTFMMGRR